MKTIDRDLSHGLSEESNLAPSHIKAAIPI